MKKITIKHYLNKEAKPKILFDDIEGYPLYLQVVTNRKCFKLKSVFCAYMSEKAFFKLLKGENDYIKETQYLPIYNFDIKDEVKVLEKAIRYLVENNIDFKLNSYQFNNYLSVITERAFILYCKVLGNKFDYDDETNEFLKCFNVSDKTIFSVADIINRKTETNILKFVPAEAIKNWEAIEEIRTKFKNVSFLDYIYKRENVKLDFDNIIKRLDKQIKFEIIAPIFN